jgi:hypothetical protein
MLVTPVPELSLVINALRSLNSKFSHAISTITAMKLLPSFLHVRNYLLQEENHQLHTAKMEATMALMATSSKGTPATPKQPSSVPAPSSSSLNKHNNKSQKWLKQSDDNPVAFDNSSQASTKSAPLAQYNPWTDLVQAWPLQQWRPATSGLLGVRPPLPYQALLVAAPRSALTLYYDNSAFTIMQPALNPFLDNTSTPPGLPMALHAMLPPTQYQGGDWFMDTGASGHATNTPGIVSSTRLAPSTSHIIVGNGAPLHVRSFGSTTIPSIGMSLSLNNVMISPGLIKNLISVRSFTRDNWVLVKFDPFGFSIKDLQTKTILL